MIQQALVSGVCVCNLFCFGFWGFFLFFFFCFFFGFQVNTVLQLLTIYASLAAPIFSFADHPALHGLW
jgi:hypothetical protein